MAEYIDRDAFLKHLQKGPLFSLVEQYGITGVIESFPAADVQFIMKDDNGFCAFGKMKGTDDD